MIANRFKAPVTAFITPLCRGMLAIGITANALTTIGAAGSVAGALFFFSHGHFFIGTLVVTLFALSDLFDGTMARLSKEGSTRWGALIDSTLDRLTDAAICAGILVYAYSDNQMSLTVYLALSALVTGSLIPYIRAKAESLGINCNVGIAERTERLIALLIGTSLYGLGVTWALDVTLGIVVALGLITIAQRLAVVARS